jgi:hypothetical protein
VLSSSDKGEVLVVNQAVSLQKNLTKLVAEHMTLHDTQLLNIYGPGHKNYRQVLRSPPLPPEYPAVRKGYGCFYFVVSLCYFVSVYLRF